MKERLKTGAAVSCNPCPYCVGGVGFVFWLTTSWTVHGISAWVVHGILAGLGGPCILHGAWHRCMGVHAASCMGGVPAGGWEKCM